MSKIIKFACVQDKPIVIDGNVVLQDNVVDDTPLIGTTVADDLIKAAKDEATKIIEEAKTSAENYVSEANQKVEQITKQAHDDGYQCGYQEGITQGVEQGIVQGKQSALDEMQQRVNEAIARAQSILVTAQQETKDHIFDAERQIIEIALAVASKILAYEVSENPMVVLPLVKAALDKVRDQEEIVIRVSHDDFDVVLQAKHDWQNMVGREHALTITADCTIPRGSCVIDTSYGTVDARLDTQYETIKKALQGVCNERLQC